MSNAQKRLKIDVQRWLPAWERTVPAAPASRAVDIWLEHFKSGLTSCYLFTDEQKISEHSIKSPSPIVDHQLA